MIHIYSAILHGDRLEWTDAPPTPEVRGRSVRVKIEVEDEVERAERGRRMADALRKLAAGDGALAEIEDPVAWEREIRQERPLPGREQ